MHADAYCRLLVRESRHANWHLPDGSSLNGGPRNTIARKENPMSSGHLIADETTPTIPEGAWLKLSAALSEQIPALADRDDLMVAVAPGAGRGSPGCFLPALATVELDGEHLGVDPATCRPSRPSDRDRYPTLWGVFTHEAAHAHHTRWQSEIPDNTAAAHAQAALLLEESRIEAKQLDRRPGDRHWLRASTTKIILDEFTPNGATTPQAQMTREDAAHAAALLLGRVDAGVLDEDETIAVATTVTGILGDDLLGKLRDIWRAAHQTGDDDAEAMLDLGRRWCELLGTDPDQHAPESGAGGGTGQPGQDGKPTPLMDAITSALNAVAAADNPPPPDDNDTAKTRAAEQQARQDAERAAHRVFVAPDPGARGGSTAITHTRPPSSDEQAAARRLARTLRAAAHRERAAISITSPTPPGRLRMRAALAADAQRAAGALPTAEPFTRTVRKNVPNPPLRVGVACDVSGSMAAWVRPVASAAWIIARAASHLTDARSATVIYGENVRAVTRPGKAPTRVSEFSANDSDHKFSDAIDALEVALNLTRPGAARLLVIVSDGIYNASDYADGQARVSRLVAAGVGVLWLAPEGYANPMAGTHVLILDDPAEVAQAIGKAAASALRNA
jgi:hypothetical protein